MNQQQPPPSSQPLSRRRAAAAAATKHNSGLTTPSSSSAGAGNNSNATTPNPSNSASIGGGGGGGGGGGASIGPSESTLSAGTSLTQQHQPLQHHHHHQQHGGGGESQLPTTILRALGDRSNEKRKNAALEIEALVKSLQDANNVVAIQSIIDVLSRDFCTSMNSNYRKGGLVGLAATSIGLMQNSRGFLPVLLPPVLHCFDDPESRVRYYACESLYNIAKVSRQGILQFFNQIFEGLTKVIADVDIDVKNGAQLLDRLIKDIVTEADNTFQVEQFLPLLQKYIQRTNPYIRQLIVGWITLLDSVPDISMLDYLPDFLDGLFNMLSDSNREIRQAADSALSDFLKELTSSTVMEFTGIVSILVSQCKNKEQRLNRLTAITWLAELIHHPYAGGDALLPYHAEILGAIMSCISDGEMEIRLVAERTNDDLLSLVKNTKSPFELRPLLECLIQELMQKEDVPTKMAALGWINALMEKRKVEMNEYIEELLPVLIRTLSDPSDAVVLLNLQVLSRISLAHHHDDDSDHLTSSGRSSKPAVAEEQQFELVLNAILSLFAKDRQLLETRGSLIVRKLCVLLNAKSVYIRLANALMQFERKPDGSASDFTTLEFVSTMVQTLNLILLTASELHDLRGILSRSFVPLPDIDARANETSASIRKKVVLAEDNLKVFVILYRCWCHSPVASFSLCLLAQAYDLSFALVKRFSEMEDVSVGFLMQIDKLVYLLESPIFVHLRLKLLDTESPSHGPLLKSIYGILLCLPQGDAFRLLNSRLTTVCNLRDSLGLSPVLSISSKGVQSMSKITAGSFTVTIESLLARYDEVRSLYEEAMAQYDAFPHEEQQKRLQVHVTPNVPQSSGLQQQVQPGVGAGAGGRIPTATVSATNPYDRRAWE